MKTGKRVLSLLLVAALLLSTSVAVFAEAVLAIDIATLPAKLTYTEWEALDVTGGELTVYYSGSQEVIPITEDMVTGFDSNVLGTQTLTVSYAGAVCTYDVLITILAAMAEQESRTISTNIKWAYQRKFQAGDIVLNTGLMLGYRKVGKDEKGHGVYEIYEPEAEIVRRIYRDFISGITVTRICRNLEADGIPTPLGKQRWHSTVIENILTNEKYTGNAVLGKTYKPDVLTKKRLKNDGEKAPMYYVEGTHPAIVDMETFRLAKAELDRRKAAGSRTVGTSRFTSKYPFSGLLICGECGAVLRRHVRTMGAGNKVASWACRARVSEGRAVCDSHHVREDVLERTYTAALRKMADDAAEIIEAVRDGARSVIEPDNAAKLAAVEQEIIALQEKALGLHKEKQNGTIAESVYTAAIKECSKRMQELESAQADMQTAANRYAEVKAWIDAF